MVKTPEEQKEFEEFKEELIAEYGFDRIQTNLDVVEDALHTSKLPDGIAVPIQSYTPDASQPNLSYENPTATINVHTNVLSNKVLMRSEKDRKKIFSILLDIKERELAEKQQAYETLVENAHKAWYYYSLRVPADQRYSAYLSRTIDESYFLENLYPCPYDMTKRCVVRYKDPSEYKRHYH
jgi:hypothetical protein